MSKSLALVGFLFLTAILAAPAALAQAERSITLSFVDLPTTATTNDTVLALPFTVHAVITGPACPSLMGASYDVTLSATVTNSSQNGTTVVVNPASVTFRGSTLPVSSMPTNRDAAATLLVYSNFTGMPVNATVHVTASFAGGPAGCAQTDTPAAEANQDVKGTFLVPEGYSSSAPAGTDMPALPLVALLAVLAVVGASRRSK